MNPATTSDRGLYRGSQPKVVFVWSVAVVVAALTSYSVEADGDTAPNNIAAEWTHHEVCQWENFDAACPSSQSAVIVVDEATYGRRVSHPGRCIERAYDRIDCIADVRALLASRCSGRRKCRVTVPSSDLDRSPHGCQRDLKANLEISYHCVEVQAAPATDCSIGRFVVNRQNGLLASIITNETRVGSASCPWTIEVQPGQTITLTLIDFSGGTQSLSSDWRSRHVCIDPYAVVHESSLPSGRQSLCPPSSTSTPGSESIVYRSNGHTIQLVVNRPRESTSFPISDDPNAPYFLIRYEAEGCADFDTPTGTVIERRGDVAVIRCTENNQQLTLNCVNGTWSPSPPTAGCWPPTTPSASAVNSDDQSSLALSKQGLFIIAIVAIAAVVSVIIVTVGVICLCRSTKRGCNSRHANELQYVSSNSAKYSAPVGDVTTWKQQQQQQHLLASDPRQRQAAVFYTAPERDYATTLQMRRSAAPPPASSSSTPVSMRPAPPFDIDAAAACACPLHGNLAIMSADPDEFPPPPLEMVDYQPSTTTATPRFSSFRPRVEHIYEVPKFLDAAEGDEEEVDPVKCSSPLYSDLDTTRFGTVGRRTPSLRNSNRRRP